MCKIFLILCLFLTTCGCQHKEKSPQEDKIPANQVVLATINGKKITFRDYQQSLKQLTPAYTQLRDTPGGKETLNKLQKNLLDKLIAKHLMLEEAERLQLRVSAVEINRETQRIAGNYAEGEFENNLRQEELSLAEWQRTLQEELLIKKLIFREVESQIEVGEEEIDKYYQEHLDEFKRPERIKVRHIVVEKEEEARDLSKKLRRRGSDFAKLAETHSLSPEGAKGGDLRYFARGQMLPKFEEVAFSLKKKGQISQVFQTVYGYHIFQLVDRQSPHEAPLEEVKEEIRDKLWQGKLERAFQVWLSKLKSKAQIKLNAYFIKNS